MALRFGASEAAPPGLGRLDEAVGELDWAVGDPAIEPILDAVPASRDRASIIGSSRLWLIHLVMIAVADLLLHR